MESASRYLESEPPRAFHAAHSPGSRPRGSKRVPVESVTARSRSSGMRAIRSRNARPTWPGPIRWSVGIQEGGRRGASGERRDSESVGELPEQVKADEATAVVMVDLLVARRTSAPRSTSGDRDQDRTSSGER